VATVSLPVKRQTLGTLPAGRLLVVSTGGRVACWLSDMQAEWDAPQQTPAYFVFEPDRIVPCVGYLLHQAARKTRDHRLRPESGALAYFYGQWRCRGSGKPRPDKAAMDSKGESAR
jgi:hypothetical protein